MTTASFSSGGVSSLAEVLAQRVGTLTLVPAMDLPTWLPDISVPEAWKAGAPGSSAVTRMLLRRVRSDEHWDACEVLNLYRVAGAIPESLVLEHIDRTLRDAGAAAIRSERIEIPAHYDVIAARASGFLSVSGSAVNAQYTDYAVNTPAGGALIEQTVLVIDAMRMCLDDELASLSMNLEYALLASIDRAPRSQRTDGSAPRTTEAAQDPRDLPVPPPPMTNYRPGEP